MSAKTFDPERLMKVLIAPQVSEKATFVGEHNNQVVFRVARARPIRSVLCAGCQGCTNSVITIPRGSEMTSLQAWC